MGQLTVTTKDLRRVRSLLDPERPCRPDRPDDLVPQSFLADVATLVPCDDITFLLIDFGRHQHIGQGIPEEPKNSPEDDEEAERLAWESYWESPACHYPESTGDRGVARMSDFHSQRELRSMKFGAFAALEGFRHEVCVPLPVLDEIPRRLVLFRDSGPDFSERDVLLLGLLRPHLIELHLRRLRELRGQPELTPRQWDVLRLLGNGCTNRQAGRVLGISEATVGKHLENAYARLGVNSRTEALARITSLERDAHTVVS